VGSLAALGSWAALGLLVGPWALGRPKGFCSWAALGLLGGPSALGRPLDSWAVLGLLGSWAALGRFLGSWALQLRWVVFKNYKVPFRSAMESKKHQGASGPKPHLTNET
jgi:hypothetical protein